MPGMARLLGLEVVLAVVVALLKGLPPHAARAASSASYGQRPPDWTPRPILLAGVKEDMVPKPYLGTSVTGATVSFDASRVRQYDGMDKDVVVVDLEGQGPVRFSLPRWNQGDFAPRLQPTRPFSQPNLAIDVGTGYGSRFEEPQDVPAQAWRPSLKKGVVLGSVARNGQKWNDSVPLFYGTVACVYASHGFGYSMDNGEFSNANPNMNIAIGKLGWMLEANIDVAIAWFPYYQGWVAGYVDTPGEYSKGVARNKWTIPWSFSPLLPEDASQVVSWDELGALLTLPGADASSTGMLFCTSTNPGPGNNDGNVVSLYPSGRSWRVQVREDDEPNPELFCQPDQAMFAFVYVPYTAGGLIGGLVNGETGAATVGRGSFSCKRVALGTYHIDIFRPGLDFFNSSQPLSNRDGMFLLQVVGHHPHVPRFSRHAVLSYFILPNGTTEVQSHRLERPLGKDESYPFFDTDFYWAWVDYRTPLTPTPEAFTGRFLGEMPVPSMRPPGFWEGLVAGICVFGIIALLAGLSLYVGARVSQRSSLLAMAPLPPATAPPLEDSGVRGAGGGGAGAPQRAGAHGADVESEGASASAPLLPGPSATALHRDES